MKQQQVDRFKSKFQLLNSQESSEEIIWSCSDSSDYENFSYNEINIKPIKRRRRQTKKNTSKNIPNLDVTFIDKTEVNNEKSTKSPDNTNIQCLSDLSNVACKSPILASSQRYFAPFIVNKSPVLLNNCKGNKSKSPVLILKNNLRNFSPKVRKKLFDYNKSVNIENKRERSMSPVLTCTPKVLKPCNTSKLRNQSIKSIDSKMNVDKQIKDTQENNIKYKTQYETPNCTNHKEIRCFDQREHNNEDDLDDTLSVKSVALIEKVKSYFDSHFSSTTPSQHSISEYESKSSPNNDDIEIINSLTEVKKTSTIKIENKSSDSLNSFSDVYGKKNKKIRYKKNGLAYRLNTLLKKQNASTSLWYHERFLAANSNFVLPKEEFSAFRIEKVSFKYGCYLLNVLDANNEKCLMFINNLYVKNNLIQEDTIFKLYKPYKIIQFDGYKLIINVCKYECVLLQK